MNKYLVSIFVAAFWASPASAGGGNGNSPEILFAQRIQGVIRAPGTSVQLLNPHPSHWDLMVEGFNLITLPPLSGQNVGCQTAELWGSFALSSGAIYSARYSRLKIPASLAHDLDFGKNGSPVTIAVPVGIQQANIVNTIFGTIGPGMPFRLVVRRYLRNCPNAVDPFGTGTTIETYDANATLIGPEGQ